MGAKTDHITSHQQAIPWPARLADVITAALTAASDPGRPAPVAIEAAVAPPRRPPDATPPALTPASDPGRPPSVAIEAAVDALRALPGITDVWAGSSPHHVPGWDLYCVACRAHELRRRGPAAHQPDVAQAASMVAVT